MLWPPPWSLSALCLRPPCLLSAMCPLKPWPCLWTLSALGLLWGRAVASSNRTFSHHCTIHSIFISCSLVSFLDIHFGSPNLAFASAPYAWKIVWGLCWYNSAKIEYCFLKRGLQICRWADLHWAVAADASATSPFSLRHMPRCSALFVPRRGHMSDPKKFMRACLAHQYISSHFYFFVLIGFLQERQR